jgi:hypothetical protein
LDGFEAGALNKQTCIEVFAMWHLRPLFLLGPKMKDFKKAGVEFIIEGDHEHLQGTVWNTVRLEKGLFRRKGTLHAQVVDTYGRDILRAHGAEGILADTPTTPLQVKKTLTGRIRYIDAEGNKHRLQIVG